ncbi:MAG TPA: IPT/TIG domain-containing protein, partial [Acidimicrobiales bacterium]|nr:IPT/TIG domain-containing protein [Acidimicrobiales bacterium]
MIVVAPDLSASAASSSTTITVAGGTGGGAPLAVAQSPSGLVVVGTTIYVSDVAGNIVRAIDTVKNTETTIAGTGIAGEDGDGGAATDAELNQPGALAADSTGKLFVADTGNCLVREIDAATGVISTAAGHYVAGSPAASCSGALGDGGDATAANVGAVEGLAVDNGGNLLLSGNGSRVRRVDTTTQVITTIAGGGSPVSGNGDGGDATAAVLNDPRGLAVNATTGDLYIAEGTTGLVRVVDAATSHIATFAGGGSGDPGGPATDVALFDVHSVAVGASGDVYIGSSTVDVVDTSVDHVLTVYPGGTTAFGSADALAFTAAGALLVGDSSAHLLRSIDAVDPHTVTTVAGNGNVQYSGDGADATDAELSLPQAVAVDSTGNVYIADTQNTVVRRVDTAGKIATIAGTGVQGFAITEGAPATSATLASPAGVAVNAGGDVYIADAFVGRVYRVDASTQAITTYAGGGSPGDGVGDGGAATAAHLEQPRGLALDAAGNLYIADYGAGRVRRVDVVTGKISTEAIVNGPAAVALNPTGDLFIAEAASNDVREVDSVSHVITTIAGGGNGASGWGDGLPATNALLANPSGLAFDADGLLIADTGHCVVRQVDSSGFINVIAGRDIGSGAGVCATGGDGGKAGDALLDQPQGLAIGAAGEVLVADTGGNRIRDIGASSSGGGGGGTPPPERPVITGVDPVSGLATGGNDVTIEGTGFASTSTVAFGKVPATNVRHNTDGSIT